MIPHIIHYCWFGGKKLPRTARKYIRSWKKYCPGWEIRRWDETNVDLDSHPFLKEALEAGKYAFATDIVRLQVLLKYGGLYMDTDVELIRPLDDLMTGEGFMGFEPARHGDVLVATGLGCAAVPEQRLIKMLLADYDGAHFRKEDGSYDVTACTTRNTEFLKTLGLRTDNTEQTILGIRILPSEYLCPKNTFTGETHITPNTHSIHHYAMSWLTSKEKNSYRRNRFVYWLKKSAFGRFIVRVKKKILG